MTMQFAHDYTHQRIIDWTQHFSTYLIWALVNMNKGHYSTSCVTYTYSHISTTLLNRHCSSAQRLWLIPYHLKKKKIAETANDFSNILSNVKSIWLSHKLKALVQSQVTDSIVVFQETCTTQCTWKVVFMINYHEVSLGWTC